MSDIKHSIQISGALESLKKKARFNQDDLALIILAFIASIGVGSILISFDKSFFDPKEISYFIYPQFRHQVWILLPVIFSIFFIARSIRDRIISSKKMLSFHREGEVISIDLDEQGITIPTILLLDNISDNPSSVLGSKTYFYSTIDSNSKSLQFETSAISIKWGDIVKCESGYISENRYNGESGIRFLRIRKKKGEDSILINRDLLKDKEKEKILVDCARQHIKIDSDLFSRCKEEKKDIWGNRIFQSIKIILLLTLLIPFLLYFLKTYFGIFYSFL